MKKNAEILIFSICLFNLNFNSIVLETVQTYTTYCVSLHLQRNCDCDLRAVRTY